MLARNSIAAHRRAVRSSSSRKTPVFSSSRIRSQKILNKPQTKKSAKSKNSIFSYFLRILLSGVLIAGVVGIVLFLRKNLTHSIDLNTSYTILLQEPGGENAQSTVVSLRGSEKSVEFVSVNTYFESVLYTYFPIDARVRIEDIVGGVNKRKLAAIFAPWNQSTQSNLTFFDRLKIWHYLLSVDSSHVEEQEISTDPKDTSKLLSTIQKYFSDTSLRQLAPTIAIVNTTGQNGVAKQLADILNAWGFTVIQIDSNNQQVYEQSVLITEERLRFSSGAKRLELALPKLNINQDDQVLRFYRTEFVLFVGNDYQLVQE